MPMESRVNAAASLVVVLPEEVGAIGANLYSTMVPSI